MDRQTIFITHAAPEDNLFATWLSAKLANAGYNVWVDLKRLRGGDDFWDRINEVLRNESIKQIVIFSKHINKLGVKKELAIGDAVGRQIKDPAFMIPIRVDDVPYSDAPTELIRRDILPGFPNWHDCLERLFITLSDAGVPKAAAPNADALSRLVQAREEGRRFLKAEPEDLLTNWFPWIAPIERIRFYGFGGTQEQMKAWLKGCRVPHVPVHRLAATFADPAGFADSGPFDAKIETAYDLTLSSFLNGDKSPVPKEQASKIIVNLMRQHFDAAAERRGLLRHEFSGGQVAWFFPAGEAFGGPKTFEDCHGQKRRRTLVGKFKTLQWHLCLVAKPRVRPEPLFRIHANVLLSEDGRKTLDGDKLHKKRRRLTRSWWNDIWRDRLLAAMSVLAEGKDGIDMAAGNENLVLARLPLRATIPVTYEEVAVELVAEETDDGEIILDPRLDGHDDDISDETDEANE